jgi:phosphate transport system protein
LILDWPNKFGDQKMSDQPHSRSTLDRELVVIQDNLVRMGEMVDNAIQLAINSMKEKDVKVAEQIVADDEKLNELRFHVEEVGLSTMATQQPAAGDLRTIIAAMNIVGDLERMGDHAAGIAKTTLRMAEASWREVPVELEQMTDLAREMLRKSMKAYIEEDTDLAYSVASQDDYIDQQYKTLFRSLVKLIGKRPEATESALYLMFAGHNLERIADRATNVAERVIFLSSGEMTELNPEPDESATN